MFQAPFVDTYMHMDIGERGWPYLGRLPKAFMSVEPAEEKVLKGLDSIAAHALAETPIPTVNGLTVEPLRETSDAKFFKVYADSAPADVHMMKVFKPDGVEIRDVAGPLAAMARGLYFKGQGVQDVAKFTAGNPRARWMLSEFIDASKPYDLATRGNQTLQACLAGCGHIGLTEFENPTQYVNGIRVDYEGFGFEPDMRRRHLV
ncbi:MAG: hypothetical protein KC474_11235 [Cyanobacteria bacterium HKST-UBA04]|nr:hypothetical protein [Cyanobacteria bacterium HKST-UBA04]